MPSNQNMHNRKACLQVHARQSIITSLITGEPKTQAVPSLPHAVDTHRTCLQIQLRLSNHHRAHKTHQHTASMLRYRPACRSTRSSSSSTSRITNSGRCGATAAHSWRICRTGGVQGMHVDGRCKVARKGLMGCAATESSRAHCRVYQLLLLGCRQESLTLACSAPQCNHTQQDTLQRPQQHDQQRTSSCCSGAGRPPLTMATTAGCTPRPSHLDIRAAQQTGTNGANDS